jgi:DNA repair ATPase RecN
VKAFEFDRIPEMNKLEEMIRRADDPLREARSWIRSLEDAIRNLTSGLRTVAGREARARKQMETVEEKRNLWQRRLGAATEESAGLRHAEERVRVLEEEFHGVEVQWWEILQEQKALQSRLHLLEDRAQEVRRLKEDLIHQQRRGKSSSDFIAVRMESGDPGSATEEIERELTKLKNRKTVD